ncbi:Hypothetical protein NTJ_03525 [Nesidiocoris tenuis]|uniref:Uncharacterized protein n=1 Tax=Nesidiocoris tenuis TaxID=355587 RepID=A0ABN7AEL8_9HEMI|nr:Hypothetical protein NTJ_03525 [Nesidiocoris tenuis]
MATATSGLVALYPNHLPWIQEGGTVLERRIIEIFEKEQKKGYGIKNVGSPSPRGAEAGWHLMWCLMSILVFLAARMNTWCGSTCWSILSLIKEI